MKKIGFIGALLASTALAACGGGGGGAEQDSDAQTAGEEMASGAETAAETVETAAEETMDAAEDAADETMEAAEEAAEDAGDAMSDEGGDDTAEAETGEADSGETEQASADGAPGGAGDGMITVAGLTGDPGAGRRIFVRCQTCHALEEGVHKNGPSLYGIFGREAGSVEGYGRYSDANANSGITWSHETMFEYLENPRQYIPGTHMAFPGLPREQDRADVIAYIEENGGGAAR